VRFLANTAGTADRRLEAVRAQQQAWLKSLKKQQQRLGGKLQERLSQISVPELSARSREERRAAADERAPKLDAEQADFVRRMQRGPLGGFAAAGSSHRPAAETTERRWGSGMRRSTSDTNLGGSSSSSKQQSRLTRAQQTSLSEMFADTQQQWDHFVSDALDRANRAREQFKQPSTKPGKAQRRRSRGAEAVAPDAGSSGASTSPEASSSSSSSLATPPPTGSSGRARAFAASSMALAAPWLGRARGDATPGEEEPAAQASASPGIRKSASAQELTSGFLDQMRTFKQSLQQLSPGDLSEEPPEGSATAVHARRMQKDLRGLVRRMRKVDGVDDDLEEEDFAGSPFRFSLALPWAQSGSGGSSGGITSEEEERAVGPFQRQAEQRRKLQRRERGSSLANRAAREKKRRFLQNQSLRDAGRAMCIVTTASLPWMTGTSVNPLLRAAYLANDGKRSVTLMVPWLAPADQKLVHPQAMFGEPAEQEAWVRRWVADRVGFEPNIKLAFYPGRYAIDKGSILPVGDITRFVPEGESDVAVLEEPEHLNWYHHGTRWTTKFNHVVGVIHTNYLEYVKREENGDAKEKALRFINQLVCRSHCHKVVKLSGAVQDLPRSEICNVHGVGPRFLRIGKELAQRSAQREQQEAQAQAQGQPQLPAEEAPSMFGKGVYFLGKVVWGKGYTELLDLVEKHNSESETKLSLDVYGDGDDLSEVKRKAEDLSLPLKFHGRADHADPSLQAYKVFVNPSLSDVVATTTAEALAMGKFVVVAEHPSNEFFSTFSNCLVYRNEKEFSQLVEHALKTEPKPLSADEQYRLSWEAATERFMDAAELKPSARPNLLTNITDWFGAQMHNAATGSEVARALMGAGKETLVAPRDLASWSPPPWEGGIIDRKAVE